MVSIVREEGLHDEVARVDDRAVDVEDDGELVFGIGAAHAVDVLRESPHPAVAGHGTHPPAQCRFHRVIVGRRRRERTMNCSRDDRRVRSANASITRGQPPAQRAAISLPSGPTRSNPRCVSDTVVPSPSAAKTTSTSVSPFQSGSRQLNTIRPGGSQSVTRPTSNSSRRRTARRSDRPPGAPGGSPRPVSAIGVALVERPPLPDPLREEPERIGWPERDTDGFADGDVARAGGLAAVRHDSALRVPGLRSVRPLGGARVPRQRRRPEGLRIVPERLHPLCVHVVDPPGARRPVGHEPCLLQHLQVLGDGRPPDGEASGDLHDRLGTIPQPLQDRSSGAVPERLENSVLCRPCVLTNRA